MGSKVSKSFKHHFLPHPSGKQRATLLTEAAIFTYCIVLVLSFLIIRATPQLAPGVLGYASNINSEDLLRYTNQIRLQHGLGELTINQALNRAADKKAQDMFTNNYWAHISPTNVKPWDFILSEQYDYAYAGENLAKNFDNSKAVVDAWYKSPSHRENLLSPNYSEIGFAVRNGELEGYQTTLVVQMFGTLRNPSYSAQNQNQDFPGTSAVAEVPSSSSGKSAENISQVNAQNELTLATLNQENIVAKNASESPLEPLVFKSSMSGTDGQEKVVLSLDLSLTAKLLFGIFGSFILSLLFLDIWYSSKKGISRVSGHALAHIIFLIVVLVGVSFVLSSGTVL
ncbi:hypothetical protein H6802_04415 [Candidatus Nomurabacteria bacterium]|uniref:SCP domain-containing protein n=1 Tax=candidate division WWE3 bacterium TaxID=2053526 RepID=A0A955DZG4_UNCKA|nr:hypothetical protein [candidate division WWE3 bacterium]MCB9824163.1 hypothetical protein [Candidatus Nomurabacteria bacterium]MCB9826866.1 hypothetical protein [Candidatus Nomurabacteria bacterium]MCB9828104.1 hypothetical protein [Candidatus Nomurabacteria bacterium]